MVVGKLICSLQEIIEFYFFIALLQICQTGRGGIITGGVGFFGQFSSILNPCKTERVTGKKSIKVDEKREGKS